MLKIKWLLFPMLLLLTSCATSGPENNDFCDLGRPIYLNSADKISPETGRQILSHDNLGQALCGWSAV